MEAPAFDPDEYLTEQREKKTIRIKAFGPYWHVSVGRVKVAQLKTKAIAIAYANALQVKINGILD